MTAAETSSGPTTVLIIEDHEMVAESLAAAIGRDPDLVVTGIAGTVEEGVALCCEQQPRVVLTDYRLPDGTGATAAQQIRACSADTQVVMMTAVDGQDVVASAIEAGCSGFVRKSQPLHDVVAAVSAAGRGETVFSPDLLAGIVDRLRHPGQRVGADLTPRELEVLQLLGHGMSTEQIVEELVVSPHTARNHVRNILSKLHAHSKLEAVAVAVRAHLITMEA